MITELTVAMLLAIAGTPEADGFIVQAANQSRGIRHCAPAIKQDKLVSETVVYLQTIVERDRDVGAQDMIEHMLRKKYPCGNGGEA